MEGNLQTDSEIKALYVKMYEGMVNKDCTVLDAVLAPAFTLTHMTGMLQSKEEYIDAILDGALNYYSARHESISVNVQGGEATLIGDSLVEAAVFGGGKGTWRLRLSMAATKQNDTWRITYAKASTY